MVLDIFPCFNQLQLDKFDNAFTMIYQSIGPKNNGDTLLVENCFVVAAFHLQNHNQILPRTV
jgi:hypothetical protein